MSKKSFKIARKPGQGNGSQADSAPKPERKTRARQVTPVSRPTVGVTTRKTIEVPEDYFYRVKMRALERKMLEKELWAEIIAEYFEDHPTA
jgi:hypothetical protein